MSVSQCQNKVLNKLFTAYSSKFWQILYGKSGKIVHCLLNPTNKLIVRHATFLLHVAIYLKLDSHCSKGYAGSPCTMKIVYNVGFNLTCISFDFPFTIEQSHMHASIKFSNIFSLATGSCMYLLKVYYTC